MRFLVSAIYTASVAICRPGLFLNSTTARCFRSSQQYCRSLPGTATCLWRENQEAFLGEKAAHNCRSHLLGYGEGGKKVIVWALHCLSRNDSSMYRGVPRWEELTADSQKWKPGGPKQMQDWLTEQRNALQCLLIVSSSVFQITAK